MPNSNQPTTMTIDSNSQSQPTEVNMDKPPWYIEVIKTLGLPTAFSCIFLYGIWTAGSWAASVIIVPLFDKQMKFIDEASEMTREMTAVTSAINTTLRASGEHSIENLKVCNEIKTVTMETNGNVKAMQESQDQILDVLKNIETNTQPLRDGMPR